MAFLRCLQTCPFLLHPLPPNRRARIPTGRPSRLLLRRGSAVAGVFPLYQLADIGSVEEVARDHLGRAEGVAYSAANAALHTSEAAAQGARRKEDWLSGITWAMETVLKVLKEGLTTLNVPYSYGFAIILLTVLVKAATFHLTKKQVESVMAMRSLQPQLKAIQQRFARDQQRMQLETARLYKFAGVNPLAGLLPTLATIPVWIGLYRALSNVADEGLLTEGFFWLPSLAGPTTIAARQSGSGTSWLFPFVDGHPPLGWSDTLSYLVLPVLLVISQYISVQIIQPSESNDPLQKNSQVITKLLPLMIGYFALSVPSGLSLYWLTNNTLSMAQQVWLHKLGGARNPIEFNGDENFWDGDTTNNQRSAVDLESKQPISNGETADPGGPRRGERFKQIKEEETRKKQKMEEDTRSFEEAAGVSDDRADADDTQEKKDQINGVGNLPLEGPHSLPMTGNGRVNSKGGSKMAGEPIPLYEDTHEA